MFSSLSDQEIYKKCSKQALYTVILGKGFGSKGNYKWTASDKQNHNQGSHQRQSKPWNVSKHLTLGMHIILNTSGPVYLVLHGSAVFFVTPEAVNLDLKIWKDNIFIFICLFMALWIFLKLDSEKNGAWIEECWSGATLVLHG